MDIDEFEKLFDQAEGFFDIESPEEGHRSRFIEKLNAQHQAAVKKERKRSWKQSFSIAATVLLLIAAGFGIFRQSSDQVSEISLKTQETQFYFTSLLEKEVEKLNTINSEDSKIIIDDVMQQLKKLENDYEKLKNKLEEDGDSERILFAMITNFQTRINLIQDVIQKIEVIKQQKDFTNEYEII